MDDTSETRGIKYLNIETRLLFAPYQNFWLCVWADLASKFRGAISITLGSSEVP